MKRYQLVCIPLSILLLIFYPVYEVLMNFDGKQCKFIDENYRLGLGWFFVQFMFFMLIVDFQAVCTRIYLYKMMNKQIYTNSKDEEK